MQPRPGAAAVDQEKHDQLRPAPAPRLRARGGRTSSICRRGLTPFASLECADPGRLPAGHAPIVRRWWARMAPSMVSTDSRAPRTAPLEEVFHLD